MKKRRGKFLAAAIILLLLAVLAGFLFYTPPLLHGAGYNLPGRAFDFLAYVYYSSRMEWFKNMDKRVLFRRAAARAAWYRPSRMKELLEIRPDDFFQLGRVYAGLGLEKKARLLFQAALPGAAANEEKSLEIISSLAILGDWPDTLESAQTLLRSYPESAEGEYWCGRALQEMDQIDRSEAHLRRACQLQPDLIDALYRVGKVDETKGRKAKARERYEDVVRRLPGHLGAWEGLVRLYQEGGEAEKVVAARGMCGKLSPPVSSRRRIENAAILKGYGMNPGTTEDEPLDLELYLEGWERGDRRLEIGLRLLSGSSPEELMLPVEGRPLPEMGEIAVIPVRRDLPPVFYPGDIDLGIVFSLSGAREQEGRRTDTAENPLITFRLNPGWSAAAFRPVLTEEKFGSGARDLGRKTFLGPGDEVKLNLDQETTAAGMGIVSYLHRGASIPQGATVGRIFVESGDRAVHDFPLIAGRDTAEVWWEFSEPWRRQHEMAPIFRSWPVDSKNKQFKAHEYYAIVSFPRPLAVKGIAIKNLLPNSGWHIAHIVLIPPGDQSGL